MTPKRIWIGYGIFVVVGIVSLVALTAVVGSPEQARSLAIPEPEPTPLPNLGIGRAEVQKRFERLLRDQGIEFEPTVSTDGNPAMTGLTENKRLGVVLAACLRISRRSCHVRENRSRRLPVPVAATQTGGDLPIAPCRRSRRSRRYDEQIC